MKNQFFHDSEQRKRSLKGPLAWMASNSVFANLVMFALIVGGLALLPSIKQEVFPEFDLDIITVSIVYPGASPAEIEQAVILAAEEAVRGVDGVKEVTSSSREGNGSVTIELLLGTDSDRALADIKAAIDRITSFPENAERPIISLVEFKTEVVSWVIYGDQSEHTLRALAEHVRDDLLQDPEITNVELAGVRPPEISIEVPREELRRYGLTLGQVAQSVRAASVEVPGGGVRTPGGEVLLRTTERRDRGEEFKDIVLVHRPDGGKVRVGDVARVIDGFQETDQEASFNGKRAVMVRIFRVGEQTPIEVSAAVERHVEALRPSLPAGVQLSEWADRSEWYESRVNLLLRNAALGLTLVLLLLGMFLEMRLAFWVTMGIPISFIGGLLFMPTMNVSINMISLFAFIVTLGIVVDDAIVVGEAIYKRRQEGLPVLEAAVAGLRDVMGPVIFAVLTTVLAFMPLLFVPGVMGKFFRNIPLIVITVLLISLVECIVILPAHLGHLRPASGRGLLGWVARQQQKISRFLEWLIEKTYVPTLRANLRWRYFSMAIAVASLAITGGVVAGGHIDFTFMPKIESDLVYAQLEMPFGTPVAETKRLSERMLKSVQEVLNENGGEEKLSRGIFAQVGNANRGGMSMRGIGSSGGHITEVTLYLVPSADRKIKAREVARLWRERVGEIVGSESLTYNFTTGAGSDAPINLELSHQNIDVLEAAASRLATKLAEYEGVKDINDGFAVGKAQLDVTLTPEASSAGITEVDLANQVRHAFFGAEAARQQRGRDELRVYVRLPKTERESMRNVEDLLLRTPGGGEMPLSAAAKIKRGRSYTEIKRKDGRRVVNVSADIEEGVANENKVVADVKKKVLPALLAETPGLSYELSGRQKDQAEAMASLGKGFLMALIGMFALMAIPFRSYVQPAIIMSAIPFGMIGALGGHLLMGFDLSLMSMMGVVALSGVVVNDSLVMISTINEQRSHGVPLYEAVVAGGTRRFRPIILTSLTTFFGLAPMILETSVQAQFLVPMAISLGFGVLFATIITMQLVPALYMVLEDFRRIFGKARDYLFGAVGANGKAAA